MNYDLETKQQLLNYLATYLTPEKWAVMQQVIVNRTRNMTIVLENIYQAHNASAVLRSADLCGIQDVHIIQSNCSFQVTSTVAMGASRWLTLHSYQQSNQAVEQLKEQGYKLVATTPHARAQSLEDFPIDAKTAFVFGTENMGLSSYMLEQADAYLTIPMYGFTNSYNVSVATALVMHTITQKLRSSNVSWQLAPEEQTDLLLHWVRSIVRASDKLEHHFLENRTR